MSVLKFMMESLLICLINSKTTKINNNNVPIVLFNDLNEKLFNDKLLSMSNDVKNSDIKIQNVFLLFKELYA